VVDGSRWVREQYDFLSLPLFVRPNSAIVVGDNDQRPDYDYAEDFTLRVYQLDDGAVTKAVIPAGDGTPAVTFTVSRKGSEVKVEWQGEPKSWRLELVGENGIQQVTPSSGTKNLTARLA
jgi:alpha-D-xyloside xylohydrolase